MSELQQAIKILKDNEFKLTKQREHLLSYLEDKEDFYIPLPKLDEYMRQSFPNMSHNTIYRNIKEMHEVGVVETKMFESGLKVKFQCDFQAREHSHFICKKCGRAIEINPNFETSNSQLSKYQIDSYCLEIFGTCDKCLA